MIKIIVTMILGTLLFTGLAIYDGIDNQDMTEPESHVWEMNPMSFNTYAKGQCTYYAFDRVKKDNKKISNRWGDAKYWAKNAREDGYKVNKEPEAGSILQIPDGKYGHVAYVEKVNDDGSLKVSDMNYKKE